MAFLRVIRDKRGYETTYLMHWFREGSRQRSRILYVFRSPGGVRVGRDALDREVLRQLEAQHPDIEFDWNSVRENQQVIEPTPPDLRRPRKRRREDGDGADTAPAAAPQPAAQPASPQLPAAPPVPSTIAGGTPDEQIAFLNTWYIQIRDRITTRVADPARRDVLYTLCERLNTGTWTDADQITSGLQQATEALERLSRVFAKRRRRSRRKGPATPEE